MPKDFGYPAILSVLSERKGSVLNAVYQKSPSELIDLIKDGADVNEYDHQLGINSLHVATALNRLTVVHLLLSENIQIRPDRNGLWPSMIALICGADDEISDALEKLEENVMERLELEADLNVRLEEIDMQVSLDNVDKPVSPEVHVVAEPERFDD